MKQKYFVFIFLNVFLIGSVFSQVTYRNDGVLKIEPGTIFSIPDQSVANRFENYGTVINEGTFEIPRDLFRNRNEFTNEVGATLIANTLNNIENVDGGTEGIINRGIIDLRLDFLNNRVNATFHNDGELYVGRDYKNLGTVTAGTSATTTFDRRGVNNTREQRIYVNNGVTNTTSNSINFNNLVIYTNTTLGVLVKDNVGIIVAGDLYLEEGELRLEGEAQLVQTGVGTNTLGTGSLLRDQQGVASGYGYNYWTSPVNNGGDVYLNEVLFDGTDSQVLEVGTSDPVKAFNPTPIQFTTAKDGIPSVVDGDGNVTTAATVSSQYLYAFFEGGAGVYADWLKIDETSQLFPGIGFHMKGTNTTDSQQNYTFKGQPNNGEYTFPLDAGESTLMGNPYPSALDADAFLDENILVFDALYFWSDGGSTSHTLSNYLGGYAVRNLGMGVMGSVPGEVAGGGTFDPEYHPGQYVAVAQGFFVSAYLTGVVKFNNSMRAYKRETETPNESDFFKSANGKKETASKDAEDLSKRSFVRLGYEDPEGFHRQIGLAFLPDTEASLIFDRGYDAAISDPREDDLFFIIENDPSKKYVIQGVGAFNEDAVFPLSLTIAEEGVHTVMLDAVDNFDSDVYIYDNVLDKSYNLSEASFSPSLGVGVYNERFVLVFKDQKSLGADDESISNFNVYFDGDQNLIINNKVNLEIEKLSVFNTLGQQLLNVKSNNLNQSQTVIPFSYQLGVYIVVVETNEGKETFRIINK